MARFDCLSLSLNWTDDAFNCIKPSECLSSWSLTLCFMRWREGDKPLADYLQPLCVFCVCPSSGPPPPLLFHGKHRSSAIHTNTICPTKLMDLLHYRFYINLFFIIKYITYINKYTTYAFLTNRPNIHGLIVLKSSISLLLCSKVWPPVDGENVSSDHRLNSSMKCPCVLPHWLFCPG